MDLTLLTIDSASIPKCFKSSAAFPDLGIPPTAEEYTLIPLSSPNPEHTASKIPPSL